MPLHIFLGLFPPDLPNYSHVLTRVSMKSIKRSANIRKNKLEFCSKPIRHRLGNYSAQLLSLENTVSMGINLLDSLSFESIVVAVADSGPKTFN